MEDVDQQMSEPRRRRSLRKEALQKKRESLEGKQPCKWSDDDEEEENEEGMEASDSEANEEGMEASDSEANEEALEGKDDFSLEKGKKSCEWGDGEKKNEEDMAAAVRQKDEARRMRLLRKEALKRKRELSIAGRNTSRLSDIDEDENDQEGEKIATEQPTGDGVQKLAARRKSEVRVVLGEIEGIKGGVSGSVMPKDQENGEGNKKGHDATSVQPIFST